MGKPPTPFSLQALALLTGCAAAMAPQEPPPTRAAVDAARMGVFSIEQAERGQKAFSAACGECHALSEFRGDEFEWRWRGRTAWALFTEISRNMPEDQPGSLGAATYADIVAFILRLNEYPPGDIDLPATRDALTAIPLGPEPHGTKGAGSLR